MASEATKMAVKGNMHMDIRVLEVADLEAAISSKTTKMVVIGDMHIDTKVIEVTDFKSEVKFDISDH